LEGRYIVAPQHELLVSLDPSRHWFDAQTKEAPSDFGHTQTQPQMHLEAPPKPEPYFTVTVSNIDGRKDTLGSRIGGELTGGDRHHTTNQRRRWPGATGWRRLAHGNATARSVGRIGPDVARRFNSMLRDPIMTDGVRPVLAPPAGEKKVLLHSCCAPCSGEVMEAMQASGIDYTIFFYNPNIHPEREYRLRKDENVRFAKTHGVRFVDADYDADNWFARAKGMEREPERGARCTMCFDMRFAQCASIRASNAPHSTPMRTAFR
jgi:hypothetical protein